MARRGSKSAGSGMFDSLVDLAAAGTMMAVATDMEEKHQYKKRGVPNPYTASAIGFTTGKLKSTSQIMRLGGFLGAMGSFDEWQS